MLKIALHQLAVLGKVATDAYGWTLALLLSIVTFFAPEIYTFTVVLVAILLDAVFAVWSARKRGAFILSKLGRVTIVKITSYFAALILLFMVEKMVHDQSFVGVRVAAAWAAACEFWSMSASILIIWPDAAFFKILRRHLRGEIEAKLGQPLEEVLPEN